MTRHEEGRLCRPIGFFSIPAILISVMVLDGCAAISASGASSQQDTRRVVGTNDIQLAIINADDVFLGKLCRGEFALEEGGMFSNGVDRDYVKMVCDSHGSRQIEKAKEEDKDQAKLRKILTVLNADCTNVVERYQTITGQDLLDMDFNKTPPEEINLGPDAQSVAAGQPASYLLNKIQRDSFLLTMGKKFADCGKFKELFEQVSKENLLYNTGGRYHLLSELEKKGVPLVAELVKYLKTYGGKEFPLNKISYAFGNIALWLTDTKNADVCKDVWKASQDGSDTVKYWTLYYLEKVSCRGAKSVAIELLQSSDHESRVLACEVLGKIGDASVVEGVQVLAISDDYSQLERFDTVNGRTSLRVYPVRDACAEAFKKIKLRQIR